MPRCKKCGYSTDDMEAFVRHLINEKEPEEKPKRTHGTAEDYLNCPKCFPKFEEAFKKRGYMKTCPNCGYPEKQEPQSGFPV